LSRVPVSLHDLGENSLWSLPQGLRKDKFMYNLPRKCGHFWAIHLKMSLTVEL
jgi:hypothetical protein